MTNNISWGIFKLTHTWLNKDKEMSHRFDVLIVGAGPAGSMVAQTCADSGLSVAMIERKSVVGTPVRCGEGVGFKGMKASIGIKKHWILAEVDTVTFISPNGTRVDVQNIGDSYCVDRTIMDKELAEDAVKKGAQLINNTYIDRVETGTEDGRRIYRCYAGDELYEAPILVAADGVESRIKQFCGWDFAFKPEDMESCAFAKVRDPKISGSTIEFYTGDQIAPGGYLWVFPRGDGYANVGLGVLGSKSKPGMAKRLITKWIKENFPDGEITDLHVGGVPVGHWINPLVKEGVLLVGDSAGQVNALNGGGIAYALFAAQAAGDAIVEAFGGTKIPVYKKLKRYQKVWNKYCGKNQARSYAQKMSLIHRRQDFYNDVAAALKNEDPSKLSYMRVFMKVFAKHPLLLLKTFFLFR